MLLSKSSSFAFTLEQSTNIKIDTGSLRSEHELCSNSVEWVRGDGDRYAVVPFFLFKLMSLKTKYPPLNFLHWLGVYWEPNRFWNLFIGGELLEGWVGWNLFPSHVLGFAWDGGLG